MMHRTLLCVLCVMASASVNVAIGDDNSISLVEGLEHGSITVQLKGRLSLGITPPKGKGKVARKMTSANVMAGGTLIKLDWSKSDSIRDELLWWTVPRHGDFREIQAEVTGKLEFRAPQMVTGARQIQPAISGGTREPVVVVESLKVQLVDHDGHPSGPQLDRTRVTSDDLR